MRKMRIPLLLMVAILSASCAIDGWELTWKGSASAKSSGGVTSDTVSSAASSQLVSIHFEQVSADPGFGTRDSGSMVLFNDRLYMIAGGSGFGYPARLNDVWSSGNGLTWRQETAAASFSGRFNQNVVVFNGAIWLIGGTTGDGQVSSEIWRSTNGADWELASSNPAFGNRQASSLLTWNNKLWLVGGYSSTNSAMRDVWYSADGVNWLCATGNAGFAGRNNHAAVIYNNKLWVTGGFNGGNPKNFNDVWNTSDGTNWTRVSAAASFSTRWGHSMVVKGNAMWVIGGFDDTAYRMKNDIWISTDGVNWACSNTASSFSARRTFGCVEWNGEIWIAGGNSDNGNHRLSDLWTSGMPSSNSSSAITSSSGSSVMPSSSSSNMNSSSNISSSAVSSSEMQSSSAISSSQLSSIAVSSVMVSSSEASSADTNMSSVGLSSAASSTALSNTASSAISPIPSSESISSAAVSSSDTNASSMALSSALSSIASSETFSTPSSLSNSSSVAPSSDTNASSAGLSSAVSSYPAGIVAEYLYSGNANDTSGYGNNGTLVGSPFLTNDRFGNSGGAYYFNGASQITAPDSEVLSSIRDQVSVSLWVYGAPRGRICGKTDNGNPCTGGWLMEIDSSGRPEVWIDRTNGYLQFLINASLSAGRWHNLAFTANANSGIVQFYIDGVVHTTNTLTDIDLQYVPEAWNQGCSNLTMGHAWGGGHVYLTGILDDVRIFNYEVSADQIVNEATNLPAAASSSAGMSSSAASSETATNSSSIAASSVEASSEAASSVESSIAASSTEASSEAASSVESSIAASSTEASSEAASSVESSIASSSAEASSEAASSVESSIASSSAEASSEAASSVEEISSAISSSASSVTVIPAGLVAEYFFNGNANDTSAFGNNGTLVGTPLLTNDRFGNSGSAYCFNGASEITAPDSAALRSVVDQVTVSLWVSGDTRDRVIGKLDNGLDGGWLVQIDGSGHPNVWLYTTNVPNQIIHPSIFSDSSWHHIAFTANANTGIVKLFVDGVVFSTNFSDGIDLQYVPEAGNEGCSNLTMGHGWGGGHGYMTGILDDVKIFNYAMDDSSVLTVYTQSNVVFNSISADPGIGGRDSFPMVAFNNRLYMIGGGCGQSSPVRTNDIWSSADGTNWQVDTAGAEFTGRFGHNVAVFNGAMWLVGGTSGDSQVSSEVWFSTNGTNWSLATAAPEFGDRMYSGLKTWNNRLWLIGGQCSTNSGMRDIWYSEDGTNWVCATENAGFAGRSTFGSVVFDNKLWVIGGYNGGTYNDVWNTTDGTNWNEVTHAAPFSTRWGQGLVEYRNALWVFGGFDNNAYQMKSDVWRSSDGLNWVMVSESAGFGGRRTFASEIWNGRIWLAGGNSDNNDSRLSDLWSTGE